MTLNAPNETRVSIKKFDAKKQIVYGEVYIPYVPDSQGDFMTPEEIERVAHAFLKKGAVDAIDTEHNLIRNGSSVVESFVARDGDPDFSPGAWVLGVHIPDKATWAKAEAGEIGGFSMYGTGRRQQRVVEIEVPDEGILFGKTAATSGNGSHEHLYALDFDQKGTFLGGETDEVNGHTHLIKKGTVTEPGPDGHRHRFSFVDTLVKGCSGMTAEQKKWKAIRENQKKQRMEKWDEEDHPRGKTTAESNEGSFAPKGTPSISNGGPGGGGGGGGGRYPAHWKSVEDDTPIVLSGVLQGVFSEEAQKSPTEDHVQAFTDYVTARYNQDEDFAARVRGRGNTGRDFLRSHAKKMFASHLKPEGGLTPSGHRPLSTIAREIRRDWGSKVHYSAKPYLDALGSLNDIKDNYYEDSGASVVAYLLGNMHSWRGDKAREIKAELNKILKIRKADMEAEDLPEADGEQKEVRCKQCQTPKACGKAGRCLISYEGEEGNEEEAE